MLIIHSFFQHTLAASSCQHTCSTTSHTPSTLHQSFVCSTDYTMHLPTIRFIPTIHDTKCHTSNDERFPNLPVPNGWCPPSSSFITPTTTLERHFFFHSKYHYSNFYTINHAMMRNNVQFRKSLLVCQFVCIRYKQASKQASRWWPSSSSSSSSNIIEFPKPCCCCCCWRIGGGSGGGGGLMLVVEARRIVSMAMVIARGR